jgi:hypothetical protein
VLAVNEHGTVERWRKGCECYRCRVARNEYNAAFRTQRRAYTTEAAETREHLLRLAANGIGWRAQEQLTGLSYSTLRVIRNGEQRRIRRSTADKVLSVPLSTRVHGHRMSKEPAVALVRELKRHGVEKQEIAAMLRYRTTSLGFMTARRRYITVRMWERLALCARHLVNEGRVPVSVLERLS